MEKKRIKGLFVEVPGSELVTMYEAAIRTYGERLGEAEKEEAKTAALKAAVVDAGGQPPMTSPLGYEFGAPRCSHHRGESVAMLKRSIDGYRAIITYLEPEALYVLSPSTIMNLFRMERVDMFSNILGSGGPDVFATAG